jgi:formate dehydrogenase major subunit
MGSNMAEQHPVGFQWVIEAKERGAKVIHVDPRFTRTSAMADLHVPIRAGTDIAFLGGIVNYIFEHDAWFEEYVRHYTNGPVIIDDDFKDSVDEPDASGPARSGEAGRREPDDSRAAQSSEAGSRARGEREGKPEGVFSGWEPGDRAYWIDSWRYRSAGGEATPGRREERADVSGEQAHGAHGMKLEGGNPPHVDNSMQDEHCVLQIVRRHFARYTAQLVSELCGCSQEDFIKVARALCESSGRERTSAIAYAVGWTQHTTGVQNVRAASIIQLLLGNIGRPGGGILALRGHANIQGSTDIPTLYNILPGYIPMPHATSRPSLEEFVERGGPDTGV